MTHHTYHVAQVNVARMLAPLDAPAMAGFSAGLEPLNALADESPGFVWRLVTEDGEQLMTVGHHFRGSRPLNNEERSHISREGICLSCHQEIPERSLAVSLLHHVAEFAGQLPKTSKQHDALVHKIMLFAGWGQVAAMVAAPLCGLAGLAWLLARRRRSRDQMDQRS